MTMFKNLTPEQFHTRFATLRIACCIFPKENGRRVTGAENAGMGIIVRGAALFRGVVRVANMMSRLRPIPRFMAAISVCRMRFYLLL